MLSAKFYLFKKTANGSFRQGITMGKCKTKVVQADLNIFTHIQHITAYSDILRHNQAYSGIFRTLCNPDIFKTMVYLELQDIQNQKHIQNRGIFRTLAYSNPGIFGILVYSEPYYVQKPGIFRIKTLTYSQSCQTSTMERL